MLSCLPSSPGFRLINSILSKHVMLTYNFSTLFLHICLVSSNTYILFFFKKFIYLFWWGGVAKRRERESLSVIKEPGVGLEPTNHDTMIGAEVKIGCLTGWATQAPQIYSVLSTRLFASFSSHLLVGRHLCVSSFVRKGLWALCSLTRCRWKPFVCTIDAWRKACVDRYKIIPLRLSHLGFPNMLLQPRLVYMWCQEFWDVLIFCLL